MDKINELKELIKQLSPEEVDEIKSFIEVKDTESEEEAEPVAEGNSETPSEEVQASVEDSAEEIPGEDVPEDLPASEEAASADEPVDDASEEDTDESALKQEETTITEDDDIPAMQKGTPAPDEMEGPAVPNIVDDAGEELPIDYQQIIDGLNAKLAASEAELKMLKAKYEGAFGYSSKPAAPAKVNKLYDDCEDVHFHR